MIIIGILRNLSFESVALRKEIVAFGGVEALLKVGSSRYCINCRPFVSLVQLSLSCDVGVATQATAALLNMATSQEEKKEMGKRGAVDTLLGLSPPPSLSLSL